MKCDSCYLQLNHIIRHQLVRLLLLYKKLEDPSHKEHVANIAQTIEEALNRFCKQDGGCK